jgi:hypothetical protein
LRRIEIPKEAIERHGKTLAVNLLTFLERLADRKKVSWRVNKNENKKKRDKHLKVLQKEECATYWKWVYEQFKSNNILIAKPGRLAAFAIESANRFARLGKEQQKAVRNITTRLFSYEKFREGNILLPATKEDSYNIQWFCPAVNEGRKKKSQKVIRHAAEFKLWGGWNIAELVRLIDVRYCPYCNAETVGTAILPGHIHVPDIDHIFPKDKYPLLSLSLYNLVPACNRCNSRFKKAQDMLEGWSVKRPLPSLHPYVDNIFKRIRFDYKPKSVGKLFIRPRMEDSPLTVSAVKDGDSCADSYIEKYHLNAVYRDIYAEEINEAIRMEAICSKDFVEAMKDLYGLDDSDFDSLFRRSSLDPRKINHFRFAKLILDLHDTIGSDVGKADIEAKLKKRLRL